MELCQLRPAYFYRLQQYNAALKQRTALLKTSFPFEPNIGRVLDEGEILG